MIRTVFIIVLVFIAAGSAIAQQERKHIRQGVKDYRENDFGNAEVNFRKALDEDEKSWEATFNTGNALYKQDKPEDAAEMYNQLLKSETSKNRKADLFYNIGNTHLKNQEYQQSIDAFRNALRIRPDDEDARYNLAYAMSMLQEQEEQENNEDEQQENDSEDEENDQQNDNNEGDQDQPQQPEEQQGLSREEAEKMLRAIEDREKEVKEEAEKKRAKAVPVPGEKDW